jgi:hypothetical protein
LAAVDDLGGAGGGVPDQAGDLLDADPAVAEQADKRGPQLARGPPVADDGQGAGGGDDRYSLVEGEGFGGAALLAFGGVGQGGDVAADQVVGFGVPDGPLEREVPHAHRGGGVPDCHGGQGLPDVGGG